MADADEALVEEVADVLCETSSKHPLGVRWHDALRDEARAVLAHLAATGRLVGEGEELARAARRG